MAFSTILNVLKVYDYTEDVDENSFFVFLIGYLSIRRWNDRS